MLNREGIGLYIEDNWEVKVFLIKNIFLVSFLYLLLIL